MTRTARIAFVASALACRAAFAQPEAPPAPTTEAPPVAAAPPATASALTPLPPPAFDPSVRRHDGFYLRLALGGGYFYDAIDSSLVGDASLSGGTFTSQTAIGGTIASGFVLGGGSFGTTVIAPSLETDAQSGESPDVLSLSILGLFADWYFDPAAGLHVQALLGFAFLSADASAWDENPKGVGAALGVGYEWWIGQQWSVGVLGNLSFGALGFTEGDLSESHLLIAPGLLAALTYH